MNANNSNDRDMERQLEQHFASGADSGIAVAALFQCLVSMLYRLRRDNQRWRIYPRALVQENRWLAQRYGTEAELVDFGKGERFAYAELLEEIIALVSEDAERLDCVAEVAHARTIAARGTGAHRQLAVYREALAAGAAPAPRRPKRSARSSTC